MKLNLAGYFVLFIIVAISCGASFDHGAYGVGCALGVISFMLFMFTALEAFDAADQRSFRRIQEQQREQNQYYRRGVK